MIFKDELAKINIILTEEQEKKFEKYFEMLVEWNKVMNLTGITEREQVYLKHFYDSLTLFKAYDFHKSITLCDVGSGAGFPSIPLKICFPNIDVTIVDSLGKRITFIQEVIKELDLKKIVALHARAEEFEKREFFDVVTSRALANINIGCELCLPLVKIGGYFLPMLANNEVKNEVIKVLGGQTEEIIEFVMPIENSKRSILKIKKVISTPKKYPRSFSAIKKSPLGR